MFRTAIWFYRNRLVTGVNDVFVNDRDLWPPITLGSLCQTKPSSHPKVDRAALVQSGGEDRPCLGPLLHCPRPSSPAAPQVP